MTESQITESQITEATERLSRALDRMEGRLGDQEALETRIRALEATGAATNATTEQRLQALERAVIGSGAGETLDAKLATLDARLATLDARRTGSVALSRGVILAIVGAASAGVVSLGLSLLQMAGG